MKWVWRLQMMLWSKSRKPRSSALKSGTRSHKNLHSSLCWSRVSISFHSTLFKYLCCFRYCQAKYTNLLKQLKGRKWAMAAVSHNAQRAWDGGHRERQQALPSLPSTQHGASSPPCSHQHHSPPNISPGKQLLPPNGMGWCYRQAGREHTSSGWVLPRKCTWHKASAFCIH